MMHQITFLKAALSPVRHHEKYPQERIEWYELNAAIEEVIFSFRGFWV